MHGSRIKGQTTEEVLPKHERRSENDTERRNGGDKGNSQTTVEDPEISIVRQQHDRRAKGMSPGKLWTLSQMRVTQVLEFK